MMVRHGCNDPYSGDCDCPPLVLSEDEFKRLFNWVNSDAYQRALESIAAAFYEFLRERA